MSDVPRVVALGPREEVMGLATAGIEPVPVESPGELPAALDKAAADRAVALILLSETVAGQAEAAVAALRDRCGPAVLLVASHRGARGLAVQWIRRAMEQRIGVDMMGGE
jgi:V/A-type H+-transporting ATPase subunit F